MNGLYNQALHHLDKAFKRLEDKVPPPQRVPHGDAFVFRYKEKTIHQAMVQKLARVVSGLHAARLLLENGLLQEQAAVQRMLDEFHEDILFLAFAVIKKNIHRIIRNTSMPFTKKSSMDPRQLSPRMTG